MNAQDNFTWAGMVFIPQLSEETLEFIKYGYEPYAYPVYDEVQSQIGLKTAWEEYAKIDENFFREKELVSVCRTAIELKAFEILQEKGNLNGNHI